jgi:predicted SprT family Zn-dependent metalloprotease
MSGWNLPPGCNENDIPGNRPEDAAMDYFLDTYSDDLEGLSDDEVLKRFDAWYAEQNSIPLHHEEDQFTSAPTVKSVKQPTKTLNTHNTAAYARKLMDEHGLNGWTFHFDNAKKRAGICMYRRKIIRLSTHFVSRNDDTEIIDTILHEIAHALAGHKAGHGPAWKAVCRKIGANPTRCYDSDVVEMPKGRWQAQCTTCKQKFYAHRKPRARERWCKKCGRTRGQIQYRDTRPLS